MPDHDPGEALATAAVTAFLGYAANTEAQTTGIAESKRDLDHVLLDGLRSDPVGMTRALAGISALLVAELAIAKHMSVSECWAAVALSMAV